ncbi:GumC family protein [Calothrix sp. PCC 6303]|uniref:GumC family protein n=1 Tax=Calothrix sp. PCC 6303 TaxID=1170562 RepID=UPI0002A00CFC|nr:GNVR domain-containing protein [Calothrix sp. PCC 6303]AFY99672.1 lipopolysaccharide biosynthesis protein [Calothrix sp. PCC 6303]
MTKNILTLSSAFRKNYKLALLTFVSVISGTQIYLLTTPKTYESSTQLMLDEKRVSVSELGRDLAQVSGNISNTTSPLANQAELVKSEPILDTAISKVNSTKIKTEELKEDLKVTILPGTSILKITYHSDSPTMAVKVLDAVGETMVEQSVQNIRKEAAGVRKFLEIEVPKAQKQVEMAEIAENRYRQSSGVISLPEQTQSLVTSLAAIEEQERVISTQLASVTSESNSLKQITKIPNVGGGYASVRTGQDEELKQLRTKLVDLEGKVAAMRLRFTDDYPALKQLIGELKIARGLYQQQTSRVLPSSAVPDNIAGDSISQNLTTQLISTEVQRQSLESKLKLLQTQRQDLKFRLARLPIQQQPLTNLVRRREQEAESLKILQTKLEEARIAESQLVGNVQIIESPKKPTFPSSPKPIIVIALGLIAAGLSSLGVVLLLRAREVNESDAENYVANNIANDITNNVETTVETDKIPVGKVKSHHRGGR